MRERKNDRDEETKLAKSKRHDRKLTNGKNDTERGKKELIKRIQERRAGLSVVPDWRREPQLLVRCLLIDDVSSTRAEVDSQHAVL